MPSWSTSTSIELSKCWPSQGWCPNFAIVGARAILPSAATARADRFTCDNGAVNAPSLIDQLNDAAQRAGLVALGVAAVEPFTDTREILETRKADGLHGGMAFTYRDPVRSTDPERILAGACSLVVGAFPYAAGQVNEPSFDGPAGRVARYAITDHYAALRSALDQVAAVLEAAGHRTRVVLDDNALVDRAAAQRAGLGWFGHNANLLVPGYGSWVVLGSIVTDADLSPSEPVPDGCGTCRRCLDGCPTGAIVAPGVVDARRCLAWLVQAEGTFPMEFREALGDRIYGCDECQEVCPPARRSPQAKETIDASSSWVDLLWMLNAEDDELLSQVGRWYIPRRDPRYLRRNALLAIGNSADPHDADVRAAVEAFALADDEMLSEHAKWSLQRLGERAQAQR
ncbi:MAG: tRNA epoxyqueuosine(34) reductase QueG [Actinobacteria bacterium]|nr:tRNA epoxyqueuosine(34) reductase QueG [Actinomycetota bacterium]